MVWCCNERGKPIPIDPTPNPRGCIVVTGLAGKTPVVAYKHKFEPADDDKRWDLHFDSCGEPNIRLKRAQTSRPRTNRRSRARPREFPPES